MGECGNISCQALYAPVSQPLKLPQQLNGSMPGRIPPTMQNTTSHPLNVKWRAIAPCATTSSPPRPGPALKRQPQRESPRAVTSCSSARRAGCELLPRGEHDFTTTTTMTTAMTTATRRRRRPPHDHRESDKEKDGDRNSEEYSGNNDDDDVDGEDDADGIVVNSPKQ